MFRKIELNELALNPFTELGKNWTLISARNPEGKVNTMTASWGAMGVLWGKETVTIYVRQTRYTKEFIAASDRFTLSLFYGHKEELGVLGTKSGRDGDKIAEVGFTVVDIDGQPGFEQAKCVLVCRKMYETYMAPEDIPQEELDKWYAKGDADKNYHTMYIAEIEGCYIKG